MTKQEYVNAYTLYLDGFPSMKRSVRTISTYSIALKRFELYLNKTNHQGDISPFDIMQYRTDLYHTGIKSNSVKHYLIILHAFFESAVRLKTVSENPVQIEELPKSESIEYDLLSLDEIKQVLKNTTNPKGMEKNLFKRNRAIVVLFLQTGLRNSELRSLCLCDLNFENGTITVRHGKGDKQRIVAMPSLSREVVQEYLESGIRPKGLTPTDLLFGNDCDKNGHRTYGKEWHALSSYALLLMIRRYVEGCTGKKDGVKVHSLRHAYASVVAEIGVPIRTVQLSLGHKNVSTTEKIYANVLNRTAVAETVNAALDNWN